MKRKNDLVTHLTREMSGAELNKPGNKGTVQLYGWSLIPNCARFDIEVKGKDIEWEKIGISKNITPTISIIPANNRGMNKYIKFQIKRLESCTDKYKFWTICWYLMKNSNSFRVSAINKVFNLWYKNMPFHTLLKINAAASKIINAKDDNLQYKRVYIPKGKDDFRPLGVPSEEWRLVLHMLSNFLSIWLTRKLLPSQHGFIPGRGTLTAWREVLDKVVDAKYIYECDLKQFFPSVKVTSITDKLEEFGIPKAMCYYLENINRCQPDLPEDMKLDESNYILTKQDHEDMKLGIYRPESRMYDGIRDYLASGGTMELLKEITGLDHPFEIVQQQWALLGEYGNSTITGQFTGVPQGAPTSPLLSMTVLGRFLTQVPSVSYADDPIFYSDTKFEIQDDPEHGIVLNQQKSGWIKFDGKWLKDLKFLGLSYDGVNNTLKASTRKGSDIEINEDHLAKIHKVAKEQGLMGDYCTFHELMISKVGGMIQARMYGNNLKPSLIEQDFRLKLGKGSLTYYRQKRIGKLKMLNTYDIFNISSYASHALYNILSKRKSIIRKVIYKPRLSHSLPSKFRSYERFSLVDRLKE